MNRIFLLFFAISFGLSVHAADYNELILQSLNAMPNGGTYASYRRDLPESQRFDELYAAMTELDGAIDVDRKGRLEIRARKASRHSFCSSATYLLFAEAIATLQKQGAIPVSEALSLEMAAVGDEKDVIGGKMDGIGIFGHWNADGPGTAVLFARLGLGENFSDFSRAKPGDFLKIFWNESIGKGERGHLVLYLGENDSGSAIRVWSSNQQNSDGSNGYGTMWVEKSRIKRALFSRLQHPENLANWLRFSEAEKTSDYLVQIRQTGSTGAEMKQVTKATD